MRTDEDFLTDLRAYVDDVAPVVPVDTSRVVPRARRRRLVTRVTSSVAATALIAVGAVTVGDALGSRTTAPPASDVLFVPEYHEPSGVGLVDPALEAGYWYVKDVEVLDDGTQRTVETWTSRDRPGLVVTEGEGAFAFGPRPWFTDVVVDGERTQVTWELLTTLPRDPAWLDRAFRDAVEPDRRQGSEDDKVFQAAVGLLSQAPVPPDLTIALVEMMAALPGTEVTVDAQDASGRLGVLVERPGPNGGRVMVSETGWVLVDHHGRLRVEQGAEQDTPIEPTLELAGCVDWATC